PRAGARRPAASGRLPGRLAPRADGGLSAARAPGPSACRPHAQPRGRGPLRVRVPALHHRDHGERRHPRHHPRAAPRRRLRPARRGHQPRPLQRARRHGVVAARRVVGLLRRRRAPPGPLGFEVRRGPLRRVPRAGLRRGLDQARPGREGREGAQGVSLPEGASRGGRHRLRRAGRRVPDPLRAISFLRRADHVGAHRRGLRRRAAPLARGAQGRRRVALRAARPPAPRAPRGPRPGPQARARRGGPRRLPRPRRRRALPPVRPRLRHRRRPRRGGRARAGVAHPRVHRPRRHQPRRGRARRPRRGRAHPLPSTLPGVLTMKTDDYLEASHAVYKDEVNSLQSLIRGVGRSIVGKDVVVEKLIAGALAGGHVLMEDYPGLGKTLLVKTFARSVSADFKRVQFTPDILPSDILGTKIWNQETRQFQLYKGPIFTNILLADEINRAPPKTQSALLEAMEERQVTIDGETHKLPRPFFVLATQNPVEQEGTYPLPEAQMDRFLIRLSMGYPATDEEEAAILQRRAGWAKDDPTGDYKPVMDLAQFDALRQRVESGVIVSSDVMLYIGRIV